MRRLKREVFKKENNERFQLIVSKVKPMFWKPCCWCDYEFRREEGYQIYMSENYNINNPSESYYICNECSGGVSMEDMIKVWENSNLYKTFRSRCYDE